jgi:hypothetical protein
MNVCDMRTCGWLEDKSKAKDASARSIEGEPENVRKAPLHQRLAITGSNISYNR